MINFPPYGLIHYEELESDIRLIARFGGVVTKCLTIFRNSGSFFRLEFFAMIDALASPRGMLRRARQQIGDLDAQIKSFMKEKPWSHVVAKDADGVTDLHKIKFTTRLSEDLPHIVFEAANNMRSALDQLGFTVANLTGKIAPKSCKFPMGPT